MRLETALKRNGLRVTQPRRAVLSALECGPAHVSAAEVLALARKTCKTVSRASVYRTLAVLEAAGVLRALPSPQGRLYVRVTDGHHHLVCQSCGEVQDFDGCALCAAWAPAAEAEGFAVAGHLLEVFGRCRDCQHKEERDVTPED